jgi:hypothetical protein
MVSVTFYPKLNMSLISVLNHHRKPGSTVDIEPGYELDDCRGVAV